MIDLQTKYMGLVLKNPLVVSSSGLTDSADKIQRLAEQGAGAVVMKSLFEEQIMHEAGAMIEPSAYPEAYDYISAYSKNHSLEHYLREIEKARKQVSIPVIASINCTTGDEWVSFARNIEQAGADALELNIYFLATETEKPASYYEDLYNNLIVKVKDVVRLPIAVKIGSGFTNLTGLVKQFYHRGAKAVVLFNRFYEPDIDIENVRLTTSGVFSTASDIRQSLRWIGIISSLVDQIDIAASTGVHDGKSLIKQLLAGATVVQVCSVLYKKGGEQLGVMLRELERWMGEKSFERLDEFRGLLNYRNIADPILFERSQFMKYFSQYS